MTLSPGYGERFREDASRFDQGTADSMIHVPMAVAAMEQIAAWGVAEIAGSIEPLVDRIAAAAEESGWKVPPKRHPAPNFIGTDPGAPPAAHLADQFPADVVPLSLRSVLTTACTALFTSLDA